MPISRRQFHRHVAACAAAGIVSNGPSLCHASEPLETFVPCRAITRGPAYHWFGYYDKRQFDPASRLVLANQVSFEGRSPQATDQIRVGYVDTKNNDHWVDIGKSNAWGWQQGCMLQWVGANGDQILWNDREGDRFVARIYSVRDQSTRTLPRPIYTLSPDGRFGLSLDFSRLDNLRPGYGYDGLLDPFVDQPAPRDSGIWRVDIASGKSELIVSIADIAAIAWPDGETHPQAFHYFNHLLINPSGERFIFLHRYRPKFNPQTLEFEGNFVTRMFTADVSGGNRYVLDPSGNTSHFIWKDDSTVTMWTRPLGMRDGFYDVTDFTNHYTAVGPDKMKVNGHNTYLPSPHQDWILNDAYPDKSGRQTVYLYHQPSNTRYDLGHFPSPLAYRGEWRCDTHPRCNDDGTLVTIDSPHEGGRQVYLLDIASILKRHS